MEAFSVIHNNCTTTRYEASTLAGVGSGRASKQKNAQKNDKCSMQKQNQNQKQEEKNVDSRNIILDHCLKEAFFPLEPLQGVVLGMDMKHNSDALDAANPLAGGRLLHEDVIGICCYK